MKEIYLQVKNSLDRMENKWIKLIKEINGSKIVGEKNND